MRPALYTLLAALAYALTATDIPLHEMRFKYFIVHDSGIAATGPVFRQQKAVASYRVISQAGSLSLCEIVSASHTPIDESCTIATTKPAVSNKPSAEAPSMVKIPATPAETISAKTGIVFRQLHPGYLSSKPFEYKEFGTLEKVKEFLAKVEGQIGTSTCEVGFIDDASLQKNKSQICAAMANRFCICIVGGRLGYAHVSGGEIEFKTVLNSTLAVMADKFIFFIYVKD